MPVLEGLQLARAEWPHQVTKRGKPRREAAAAETSGAVLGAADIALVATSLACTIFNALWPVILREEYFEVEGAVSTRVVKWLGANAREFGRQRFAEPHAQAILHASVGWGSVAVAVSFQVLALVHVALSWDAIPAWLRTK